MVNEGSVNEYEHSSTSELPENKLRHNFRLGDVTWVKHNGCSWWPAQVIDEACVGSKPKKKAKHDCLVRLYGTCQYLYVDPLKSNIEFKMMLKQESKSATEVFRAVLEKELSHVNSSDYDEEGGNLEGTQTKVTSEKTSSRKGKKQAAATENEDQDQEVGSTAKGKHRRGRKSSLSHDTTQTTDKDSCDNSAGSLRGKRQKQEADGLDKEGCKIGSSAGRREGLRRSARANAKEYLDAAEDATASLTVTGASEDATEVSMVDGTSAPHTEIKAMVRDILFKEIIDREQDAEMAYVDEVINGICNTTVESMLGSATASTKSGQGIEQNGTGGEGEPTNVTLREREGKSEQASEETVQVTSPEIWNLTTENINSKNDNANPSKESRDPTTKELGQLSQRHIRQIRIMQSLGLMAPSGSPFGKNGVVGATRQ